MASDLDRLYTLLTQKTGIIRKRDVRLEKIAADRALEARYQVGLTASGTAADNIQHPTNQLVARTFPLHPTATRAVFEVAEWVYLRNDPIQSIADGWWNSSVHRQIIQNATLTTWGLGLHREFKAGDTNPVEERWYAIGVLTYDLEALAKPRLSIKAGTHQGIHVTADGQLLGTRPLTLTKDSGANFDARMDIPGRGPHLHVVNGGFRDWWVPESPSIFPSLT